MLHVNDNNDELFRRAAESYPLKIDSADWDSLRAKLESTETGQTANRMEKKGKYYRLIFLLLLLIPYRLLENRFSIFFNQTDGKKHVIAVNKTESNINALRSVSKIVSLKKEEEIEKTNSSHSTQWDVSTHINRPQHPVKERNKFIARIGGRGKNYNKPGKQNARIGQMSAMTIRNAFPEDIAGKYNNNSVVVKDLVQKEEKTIPSSADITSGKNVTKVPDNLNPTSLNTNFNKVDPKGSMKGISIEKKEDNKNHLRIKRFYAGLEVGPDLSSVRFQSIKKIGYGIGIIAGYKLTRKFSVETGLFFDKKYYSTDGRYFSTKNINIPAYASISRADGNCNMLEIPVIISYAFIQRKTSGWIVSIGASSYFMNKESYWYDMNNYGNQYTYSAEYKNKSTSLLAVIDLGLGYRYHLGKIADLRIEPFIKLPLSKIGTGLLPIQSAGINIGITKSLF